MQQRTDSVFIIRQPLPLTENKDSYSCTDR
jgi:hypothetical protein